MRAALEGKKREMAAEAGRVLRTSARPTLNLVLLLHGSV
jgi:hypothetical protein